MCSSFLPVNFQAVLFNSQHLLTEITLKEIHLIHNGKKHHIQQLKQNKIYISNYIANAQDSNLDITGSITVLCFVPLQKLKYTYKRGNIFVCQIALNCCGVDCHCNRCTFGWIGSCLQFLYISHIYRDSIGLFCNDDSLNCDW